MESIYGTTETGYLNVTLWLGLTLSHIKGYICRNHVSPIKIVFLLKWFRLLEYNLSQIVFIQLVFYWPH